MIWHSAVFVYFCGLTGRHLMGTTSSGFCQERGGNARVQMGKWGMSGFRQKRDHRRPRDSREDKKEKSLG